MKYILNIFFVLQLILVQCLLSEAQVIPSERQVNWSAALNSYSYSMPSKEVNVKDFGAIGDGVNDDQPAVMKAIAALEGQLGYVYFPEGTYLMKNPVSLPDSVILKGDGSNVCEFRFDLNQSNKNCISIDKPQNSKPVSLKGGYSKESAMLYTDSAFIFDAGGYILIFQENGDWDDKPISWAKNAIGQIIRIDEIIGDTLYLKSSLRFNYDDGLNPKIKTITPIANSGVLCIKITRVDEPETGGGANVFIRYAANCFIRGVESDVSAGSHFDIFSSTRILIDGCYIHHAFLYNGASKHGYGITLNNQTGECLIIDNVFEYLRHAMMVKTGANGSTLR